LRVLGRPCVFVIGAGHGFRRTNCPQ